MCAWEAAASSSCSTWQTHAEATVAAACFAVSGSCWTSLLRNAYVDMVQVRLGEKVNN